MTQDREPAVGHRSMPVLGVKDVAAGIAFYRDKLGFSEGGAWRADDGALQFAIMALGTITVALQRDPDPAPRQGGWTAYLYIDGIDAYHAALVGRGVEVVEGPRDTFYGLREITIRDLEGHQLAFGQDLQPSGRGPGL